MTAGSVLFAVCAAICLAGALLVVTAKNPIRGAMGLLATIVGIAGLFLRLNAQFLAAMQILVYAGAVVILFVFVIMLLGPGAGTDVATPQRPRFSQLVAGLVVASLGFVAVGLIYYGDAHAFALAPGDYGSVAAVGGRIFKQGLVPFELATALLLVAVVGAIAVARSRPSGERAQAQEREKNPTLRMFRGPVNRPGAAGAARENS
jgi:NADH-quinone oxidoreductase subunit J